VDGKSGKEASMSSLSIAVEQLVDARKKIDEQLQNIIGLLTDSGESLDERWGAYTALVKNNILVKNESYGDGYLNTLGPNLTQYDDFYNDRGVTVQYIDMYDQMLEADGEYQKDLVEARDNNLAKWQEQVLASGYSSFTYDW
jgi:hypothetical protein